MCDAWQGDGVIVAEVQCDERINGSSRLMEGGGPTCGPLSGASCSRAGRTRSGWAAELFFMFWMLPCSFLPARAGMIWMSLPRVMFLKQEVDLPECIIVIQLTASVLCTRCREAADVRHDNLGWAEKHQNSVCIYRPLKQTKNILDDKLTGLRRHLRFFAIFPIIIITPLTTFYLKFV